MRKTIKYSRSKIMTLYRAHIKRLHARKRPVLISQRNVVIGTDDEWFNAAIIDRNPAWVPVTNASYVWNVNDLSSERAIVSTSFRLPLARNILSARLFLAVDNFAIVIINGIPVINDNPQNNPAFFNPGRDMGVRRFLRRGINDIAIIAFNFGGARSAANPAGVAARLNIRLSALL